ncbi:MAG: hypothetical protein ACOY37_10225 [Pseudomonadota bacterium]
MKKLALAPAVLRASFGAQAQDMRPGIASIAIVTTELDGRYGMDGEVLKPAKLKRARSSCSTSSWPSAICTCARGRRTSRRSGSGRSAGSPTTSARA